MNPNYTNNQQYNNPNPHVNTAYNQQGYIQPGQPGYIQPGQPGYVQPTCQTGCTTTQPVHQPVHQSNQHFIQPIQQLLIQIRQVLQKEKI